MSQQQQQTSSQQAAAAAGAGAEAAAPQPTLFQKMVTHPLGAAVGAVQEKAGEHLMNPYRKCLVCFIFLLSVKEEMRWSGRRRQSLAP
jgi:hypothetical protein